MSLNLGMTKRLGIYQRVVLRGLVREGKSPVQIKHGYSRQVASLKGRGYISERRGYLYLTPKAIKRAFM